jgi:hypothetical protein
MNPLQNKWELFFHGNRSGHYNLSFDLQLLITPSFSRHSSIHNFWLHNKPTIKQRIIPCYYPVYLWFTLLITPCIFVFPRFTSSDYLISSNFKPLHCLSIFTTLTVISTGCRGSCIYNYHDIRTTTTPWGYVTDVVVYLTTMLSGPRWPLGVML